MRLDWDTFKEISDSLTRNKSRSFLTGFGVFWGVFMLLFLMGGGRGLKHSLMMNFEGFANNTTVLVADRTSMPSHGFRKGRAWSLTYTDVDRLKMMMPELDVVTPVLSDYGGDAVYGDRKVSEATATENAAFKIVQPDLSGYERRVVSHYVGSMYTFSRDPAVKASPEEFVYYVPRGVDYEATATVYRLGRGRRVVGQQGPAPSDFFVSYPDGARDAYCTFMGGDLRTVRVATSTRNGRRLMILKDSYGNALPGYLFHSFEEIYVVDFRYFTQGIRQYVSEHRITDVLFANNMMHACLPGTHRAYEGLLAR